MKPSPGVVIVAMVCVDIATESGPNFIELRALAQIVANKNMVSNNFLFLFKQLYENWALLCAHFTNARISQQ